MLRFSALLSLGLSFSAIGSILPNNNYRIPETFTNEGLTEEQFNKVIDKVEAFYSPVIENMGMKLVIKRAWVSPTVNAGTYRDGNQWIINLYGGYARHPLITEDAFALVICHEIGHHLGGFPRKTVNGEMYWPSTEGQADYFATTKCLRKVFEKEDNAHIVSQNSYPDLVTMNCSLSFSKGPERSICVRSAAAGLAVAGISAWVTNSEMPKYETPDNTVANPTFESHPAAQCRLDTYFQGAICKMSANVPMAQNNELPGACHPALGFKTGFRPVCWFHPTK